MKIGGARRVLRRQRARRWWGIPAAPAAPADDERAAADHGRPVGSVVILDQHRPSLFVDRRDPR